MKEKVKLPYRLKFTLCLLSIRAPSDIKRGPEAVQERVNSMFELTQSYIHKLCKEFIRERHDLLLKASKKATVSPMPASIEVDDTSMSIVKRKAQAAETAAVANASRERAENTTTAQTDLFVYIDEHSELVASVVTHCSSKVANYLSRVSKSLDITKIKNPYTDYAFDPVDYHIINKED